MDNATRADKNISFYGQKHMITCSCFVHGLKKQNVNFQFPVFSVCAYDAGGNDAFVSKFATCTNCNAFHHVTGFCKSDIVSYVDGSQPLLIDDIRPTIPDSICSILDAYDVDMATWEEVKHILTYKCFGASVILRIESNNSYVHGKKLTIYGDKNVSIDSFSESAYINSNDGA